MCHQSLESFHSSQPDGALVGILRVLLVLVTANPQQRTKLGTTYNPFPFLVELDRIIVIHHPSLNIIIMIILTLKAVHSYAADDFIHDENLSNFFPLPHCHS
jgi:hypothetical protein